MPKRIQRKRTKGWRMPDNTKYVGRPSKWANPFKWEDYVTQYHKEHQAKQFAVDDFRDWLEGDVEVRWWQPDKRKRILAEIKQLRGFDLACWCELDEPCHADVLLELANEGDT